MDDVKFYRNVSSSDEALDLERNLQRVKEWCDSNLMSLNVQKCEIISFSRKSAENIIHHPYTIDDQMLRRTEVVKDLGILIDSRVTFKSQINQVIGRASSLMGFVKRRNLSAHM